MTKDLQIATPIALVSLEEQADTTIIKILTPASYVRLDVKSALVGLKTNAQLANGPLF